MALIDGLIDGLRASESGISYIYKVLDIVVEEFSLRDAILVTNIDGVGKQVFRYNRMPLEENSLQGGIVDAKSGLYCTPDEVDLDLGESITRLCEIALRLDREKHDATHDNLTGLLNRRSFDEVLGHLCSQATRYGWLFTLVLIDVDEFKSINDTLGHAEGDQVLRKVGTALSSTLRGGDRAARIGGDEFALILANANLDGANQAISRLRRSLKALEIGVEISIGVASAPDEGEDALLLYKAADKRLYDDKAGNK